MEAERSTAEVRALGIRERVSEFTTYYPHADYRNVNIGRAAEIVDGTLLEPGETFSLNRTVGERTAENGFTEGFVISDGILREDLGGGVSQLATTLFNGAFFAGLEDVEHKPHSFYIDRYPVGREATVAWPTVDLRFRNDTDHGVLIETRHTPSTPASQGAITVRMWSTKVWDISARTGDRYAYTSPDTRYLEGEDCVPNTGYSGFQIVVTRVFRRAGEEAVHHTERFHTTYIPSDTVVCR
jgi:vancomycin resistance protein YoaR